MGTNYEPKKITITINGVEIGPIKLESEDPHRFHMFEDGSIHSFPIVELPENVKIYRDN
jgi:hypothetical protein